MSDYRLKGETGEWEVVIGLEVHAQVSSKAKLFSGAATAFGADPNTQVSLVDAAMPGMLPVINGECVRQAVRTGLALNAAINKQSVFARKNYFYADLPQGYQISQYDQPVVGEGEVEVDLPDGTTKVVGIERLHLEQDAGKSMHDQHPKKSFIDLNRSGVALMEIVSKPDMGSPEEAAAYVSTLRSILRYIGSCDGNMAEGSMRADVNVSVRKPGEALGTRAELKNINSVRFVRQAVEIEALRQIAVIEGGGTVDQETRLFDPSKGETRSMRNKEEAHDYRYFPDPDLLPLEFDDAFVEECRGTLPELPAEKKKRFMRMYGLSAYQAGVLVADKEVAEAIEEKFKRGVLMKVAREKFDEFMSVASDGSKDIMSDPLYPIVHGTATSNTNIVTSEVFGRAKESNVEAHKLIRNLDIEGLEYLISTNEISGKIGKEVLAEMFETGKGAKEIVEAKGLKQITDSGEIEAIVDKVVADNPDQVEKYRGGKTGLIGWFVGQVMKASQGKANPKMVNDLLQKKLDG